FPTITSLSTLTVSSSASATTLTRPPFPPRRSSDLSQQALDTARAELGLDRPVWVQYLSWLGGVLQGDLGTSYLIPLQHPAQPAQDRKSTRLNSSHVSISYAVFCLKKKI